MDDDRAAIERELEELTTLLQGNLDLSAEWRAAVSAEIASRRARLAALDRRPEETSSPRAYFDDGRS